MRGDAAELTGLPQRRRDRSGCTAREGPNR
jgi:hypothetical protein